MESGDVVSAHWVASARGHLGKSADGIEPDKERLVVGRGHEGGDMACILEHQASLDALVLVETFIPGGPQLVGCRAAICAAMVLVAHQFDLVDVDPFAAQDIVEGNHYGGVVCLKNEDQLDLGIVESGRWKLPQMVFAGSVPIWVFVRPPPYEAWGLLLIGL
jgi:hypothetical protein